MVHYTLVGEGVLGEAGYHAYATALDGRGLMPGFREGRRLTQADENRHMAYGLFLLSRLLGEDPDVWGAIRNMMDDLIPDTLGIVTEFYDSYDPMPFGLALKDTICTRWRSSRDAGRSSRTPGRQRRSKLSCSAPLSSSLPAPCREPHAARPAPLVLAQGQLGVEQAALRIEHLE